MKLACRPVRFALALLAVLLTTDRAARADFATFENLTFPAGQDYFNGPVPGGTNVAGPYGPVTVGSFQSGGVSFTNNYDQTYGSWSGFAYSRVNDTVNGYPNQFGAITGTGHGGSGNYGVASGYDDVMPNLSDPNPFNPGSLTDLQGLPSFSLPSNNLIEGMYVTNTTYAYNSMTQGDPFAGTPFGGVTGTDPDFLLLTAYGTDAANNILSASVDFYLGDYRSSNSADDYILKDWSFMDLSALSGASRIYFNLSGSKEGDYGLNTPAYFAVDDIQFRSAGGSMAAVPEPASWLLCLMSGGICLTWARSRRG